MYLDKAKLLKGSAKARRQTIGGIALTAFFGFAVCGALAGEGKLQEHLSVYLFCLLASLLLLCSGFLSRRRLDSAQAYSAALSASRKSELLISELSGSVGKSSGQVSKELRWLIAKGYVTNCSFAVDGVEKVVLNNVPESRGEFIVVECPHCGAGNSIRRGASGRCEYCGGQIKGE